MVRWILIAALTLGFIGTAFWGYKEHQDKNAVLIQAENTYQRSFHNLTYHIDLLHDKIGTALAMNSKDKLSPQMVEIWRLTSEALSDVGQLPLSLLPFNKTEEFLANIGEFTYRTAVRDLDKEPLSDKEIETLENLYDQSEEIKDELRQVQHTVLDDNLRWMDVQLALATQDEPADNTIIDGFKTVENTVDEFTESDVQSFSTTVDTKEHAYQHLSGDKIDKQQALADSQDIFQVDHSEQIDIAQSGKGADVPIYSMSYQGDDKNAHMDMTVQGGHPITLLVDRPINEQKISLHKGAEKAKAYLEKFGFNDMSLFASSQYDNVGVYSFLYQQGDTRVHSDAVEVKVALDNGDILGFTARNYFMNHKERDIPKADLSSEEAKEEVNDSVDIQEEYQAVIDNDFGEEVLVYEFIGTMGGDTYRIFINAMDGSEEKVEKLNDSETDYASMT